MISNLTFTPNPAIDLTLATRAFPVLEEAMGILHPDDRWCQGESARDLLGNPVRIDDPMGYSYSLDAALHIAGTMESDWQGHDAACIVIRQFLPPGESIRTWNDDDTRTYDDIVFLLTGAVEFANRRQKERQETSPIILQAMRNEATMAWYESDGDWNAVLGAAHTTRVEIDLDCPDPNAISEDDLMVARSVIG